MAHVAPGDSPRHRSKKWPLLNWLGLVLRKTKQNLESENFFEDPFPFGAQRMGIYCQFSTHAHSCRSRQLSRTSRDAKELAVRVLLSAPEKKVTDTALNSRHGGHTRGQYANKERLCPQGDLTACLGFWFFFLRN